MLQVLDYILLSIVYYRKRPVGSELRSSQHVRNGDIDGAMMMIISWVNGLYRGFP